MDESLLARTVDESLIYLNLATTVDSSPLLALGSSMADIGRHVKAEPKDYRSDWQAAIMLLGGKRLDAFEILNGKSLGFMAKKKTFGRYVEGPAATVEDISVSYSGDQVATKRHYLFDGRRWYDPFESLVKTGKTKTVFAGNHYFVYEDFANTFKGSAPAEMCFVAFAAKSVFYHIKIGYEASRTVQLVTDSTGIHGWFKLRDVPEGRSRRAALIHWVKEHWRQFRSDPAMEVKVRQHLRGAQSFDWFGMKSEIAIPLEVKKEHDKLRSIRNDAGRLWRPRPALAAKKDNQK